MSDEIEPGLTPQQLVDDAFGGATSQGNAAAAPLPAPENSEKLPGKGKDGQWRDADGRIFDPEKHRTGADGEPVFTEKGYFTRRMPENPESDIRASDAQQNASETQSGASGTVPGGGSSWFPGSTGANDDELERSALEIVMLEDMFAANVLGGRFDDEEKGALMHGWKAVFVEHGVVKLPWWAPVLAAHWYVINNRLGRPEVQARLAALRVRAAALLAQWRGKPQ